MNITVYYSQKKLREPYLSLFEEYKRRLGVDAKLEVKAKKAAATPSEKAYSLLIAPSYPLLSSEELAQMFSELALHSKNQIDIYLEQSPYEADHAFSLLANKASEEMTMSILFEQIYRAFSILKGKTYHK